MCEECYSEKNRITPLLNPLECLENHTQYICGTCGRCICIEHDPVRGLQRWNFPFKSLEIAKLYLRTADYTTKKSCGIYEIENSKDRKSYKIFAANEDLELFLKKNKDKKCRQMSPVFSVEKYEEYPQTQVRKLTSAEIKKIYGRTLNPHLEILFIRRAGCDILGSENRISHLNKSS